MADALNGFRGIASSSESVVRYALEVVLFAEVFCLSLCLSEELSGGISFEYNFI